MSKDYYRILGVNRRATEDEIRKAYHKLALKWHPDRNPDNKEEATANFKNISEAYQVLNDQTKKRVYDDFGAAGLSAGLSGDDTPSKRPQAHTQHFYTSPTGGRFVDPYELFSDMFGPAAHSTGPKAPGFDDPIAGYEAFLRTFAGFNPEQAQAERRAYEPPSPTTSFTRNNKPQSYQSSSYQDSVQRPAPTPPKQYEKPATIERPFACTLEELYTGCTRKIKYIRHATVGRITKEEERSLQLDVKAGWHAGTKVTFRGEGDVVPGQEPGDVVFVLEEVPHPYYKREANNIIYTANITLGQAFSGVQVRIPLLGPRKTNDQHSERAKSSKEKEKRKHKHDKHKYKQRGIEESSDEDNSDKVSSIVVKIRDIIHPKYEHIVPGAGMPKSKKPGEFGDLIVRFDIKFPENMTIENRKKLKELVESSK